MPGKELTRYHEKPFAPFTPVLTSGFFFGTGGVSPWTTSRNLLKTLLVRPILPLLAPVAGLM